MNKLMKLYIELYKIYYGLRFFQKGYPGNWWVIASYHHPDSITWRWSISFDARNRKMSIPKFGPSYFLGKHYFSPNGNFGAWLFLPFIGVFSLNTQSHMWIQRK